MGMYASGIMPPVRQEAGLAEVAKKTLFHKIEIPTKRRNILLHTYPMNKRPLGMNRSIATGSGFPCRTFIVFP
eukprot:4743533-Amphidinium_carterae.1